MGLKGTEWDRKVNLMFKYKHLSSSGRTPVSSYLNLHHHIPTLSILRGKTDGQVYFYMYIYIIYYLYLL